MIGSIIKAITKRIGTKFIGVPCHVNFEPQNTNTPCFYIASKTLEIQSLSRDTLNLTLPLEIFYQSRKNQTDKVDVFDVLDAEYDLTMLFSEYHIKNNSGNVFRLQDIQIENGFDELKLTMSVNWQEKKQETIYDKMEDLNFQITN